MYCSIKIPLKYAGEDVLVVVTEMVYALKSVGKEHIINVLNGFAVSNDDDISFEEIYGDNWAYIDSRCLDWYLSEQRGKAERPQVLN